MAQCKKFNESHAVKYHFIENWGELEDCIKNLGNAIYRGQSDATWRLTTNFERRFFSHHAGDLHSIEKRMVRDCILKCRVYDTELFHKPEDPVACLSLVQHYGGSTRLLDITRSPYIALFFALAEMKVDSDACLWVIGTNWGINDLFIKKISKTLKDGRELFLGQADQNLLDETCYRLANEFYNIGEKNEAENNPLFEKIDFKRFEKMYESGAVLQVPIGYATRRSIAQQAEFLFPVNPKKSFEENFIGLLNLTFPCDELDKIPFQRGDNFVYDIGVRIMKLIIPYTLRNDFLEHLNMMNINYETLFPDKEGFMRNLTISNGGKW